MSDLVLEARDLWKSYQGPKGPVDVLRGVDLGVGRGEVVALLGASGVGTSTLLNLLGWFVTGVVIMIAFDVMRAERWTRALPTRWLVAFYGANLLLPVGMNVAAGLWGAVIATAVAIAAAWLIARTSSVSEVVA